MNESGSASPRRIAVIGGGVTGLAAAHRLLELDRNLEVTLFEASDRFGGVIRTELIDGYLVEHGADMFTTREPWAIGLCRRIGFDTELINTNKKYARAFVVRRGKLHAVPEGFTLMSPNRIWPMAKTRLLSPAGKLRMAAEYFIPARRETSDESLADFVTRRLGREAFDRLVQPLVGGIYTADPNRLSMQAALPQFVQMEREHGGLLRAIQRTRKENGQVSKESGARYGMFVAPRLGLESFLQAIVGKLPPESLRRNCAIETLVPRPEGGWTVELRDGPAERFDAVLIASPAHRASELVRRASPELANELQGIEYASAAIAVMGFRRDQFRHPLDGFGVVVPQKEGRKIIAVSLASVKFDGRAPDGCVLLRVFIGGACQPELVELSDAQLEEIALSELTELLGLTGTPQLTRIVRWRRAMPQYHVGHLDRVSRIERAAAQLPNFALAGNAYSGVGIPHCIRSGESAAERLSLARNDFAK